MSRSPPGQDFDLIVEFDANEDYFVLPFEVTGKNATVGKGRLSDAHFNQQLAARIDASHLHAGHFVLYKPDHGTYAGDIFLIVDGNGVAGYQANQDLVIELLDPKHLGHLSATNFHTVV